MGTWNEDLFYGAGLLIVLAAAVASVATLVATDRFVVSLLVYAAGLVLGGWVTWLGIRDDYYLAREPGAA
jgi:hypothetical protein